MKKSEKIILFMVVVAAIYGAVDFTMTKQKKKSVNLAAQSNTINSELTSQLSALSTPYNQKIDGLAASINEPWPEQFFTTHQTEFGSDQNTAKTQETLINDLQDKASQLIYSGFMAMGSDRVAIINNMDYRVGEQINDFTIIDINHETVKVLQHGITFTIHSDLLPTIDHQNLNTK